MSLLDSLKKFHEFQKSYRNEYEAVSVLGASAHKLCEELENVPLESEAITWILDGTIPDISDRVHNAKLQRYPMINYMEEVLKYVDDIRIADSVRDSIQQSRQHKNLEYIYHVDEVALRTRVRVLVNMIWYKFIRREN